MLLLKACKYGPTVPSKDNAHPYIQIKQTIKQWEYWFQTLEVEFYWRHHSRRVVSAESQTTTRTPRKTLSVRAPLDPKPSLAAARKVTRIKVRSEQRDPEHSSWQKHEQRSAPQLQHALPSPSAPARLSRSVCAPQKLRLPSWRGDDLFSKWWWTTGSLSRQTHSFASHLLFSICRGKELGGTEQN